MLSQYRFVGVLTLVIVTMLLSRRTTVIDKTPGESLCFFLSLLF